MYLNWENRGIVEASRGVIATKITLLPATDTFAYDATLTTAPDSLVFKTTPLKIVQGNKKADFTFGPK